MTSWHHGHDIVADQGQSIWTAAAGVVVFAGALPIPRPGLVIVESWGGRFQRLLAHGGDQRRPRHGAAGRPGDRADRIDRRLNRARISIGKSSSTAGMSTHCSGWRRSCTRDRRRRRSRTGTLCSRSTNGGAEPPGCRAADARRARRRLAGPLRTAGGERFHLPLSERGANAAGVQTRLLPFLRGHVEPTLPQPAWESGPLR